MPRTTRGAAARGGGGHDGIHRPGRNCRARGRPGVLDVVAVTVVMNSVQSVGAIAGVMSKTVAPFQSTRNSSWKLRSQKSSVYDAPGVVAWVFWSDAIIEFPASEGQELGKAAAAVPGVGVGKHHDPTSARRGCHGPAAEGPGVSKPPLVTRSAACGFRARTDSTPKARTRALSMVTLLLCQQPVPTRAPASGQNAEKGFDVGIGPDIAVTVEVGGVCTRRGGAGDRNAGEEGVEVGVGAGVAIAVEVGRAAPWGRVSTTKEMNKSCSVGSLAWQAIPPAVAGDGVGDRVE